MILLTLDFPWRHALPLYSPVLETYAFRDSDFDFIDATFAPISEISLLDSTAEDPADASLFPPVGVRCQSNDSGKSFRFFEHVAE